MPENDHGQQRRDASSEGIFTTTCSSNCTGKCVLKVHVKDGKVTRIETDDWLRACARGRAFRQHVYHPDRLRYPLKRTGGRGEGKFERISWDEALDTVAAKLRHIVDQYGPQSILNVTCSGSVTTLHTALGGGPPYRFFSLLGGGATLHGHASASAHFAASYYTFGHVGATGNDREDLLNSKLIILWGFDPAASVYGTNTSWHLTRAKEAGIKIVCIDPRYTASAATFASEWIPIVPGTDTAMMAAMAYVMIEEHLFDADFLNKYTVGFDKFRDYVMGQEDGVPKTPAWAEEITQVPAATIERLAREYATMKPAALLTGLGPARTAFGEQFARAGIVLSAMTGNIGVPGGQAGGGAGGTRIPRFMRIPPAREPAYANAPRNLTSRETYPRIPFQKWADALLLGKQSGYPVDIKMVYVTFSNLLVMMQRTAKGHEALQKPEFIVVHELFMTPTARYADILLPVGTMLERNDFSCPDVTGNYVINMPKVIEPLYECKTDLEIFGELAERLGFEQEFNDKNEEEWLRDIAAASDIDYGELRKKGVLEFPSERPFVAFAEQVRSPESKPFRTPSGKIEIFSQRLADLELPETVPPVPTHIETWESRNDPLTETYPLQLITPISRKRIHSTLHQVPWLRETEPETVWINSRDAEARNIRNGSRVRVFNDRGAIVLQAKVTERIMPGVVSVEAGSWFNPSEDGTDMGACANVLTRDEHAPMPHLESSSPPIGHGMTHNTGLVEVELFSNEPKG